MKELYLDYSHKSQWELLGSDRETFLHGMCTSTIKDLSVGTWTFTSALNAKGRVCAIFDVLILEKSILLVVDTDYGQKLFDLLDSHIIADDVELKESQRKLYKCWSDAESVWTAELRQGECPEPFSEDSEIECRRIEAGFPRYGADVSEDYFPFESGLERYIDYDKGCYIGQEPVARVKYKGEPKKVLCGLKLDKGPWPTPKTAISHETKPKAGLVTSVVQSAHYGAIALGYVYKSIYEPGQKVQVNGIEAEMISLPFD